MFYYLFRCKNLLSLFDMATDYVFYIIYTIITNFWIITIEGLVIFAISNKMFIQ